MQKKCLQTRQATVNFQHISPRNHNKSGSIDNHGRLCQDTLPSAQFQLQYIWCCTVLQWVRCFKDVLYTLCMSAGSLLFIFQKTWKCFFFSSDLYKTSFFCKQKTSFQCNFNSLIRTSVENKTWDERHFIRSSAY